jgi:hypothetical protein
LLGLGELLDVFGGVPQGNELTTFRHGNWFVKIRASNQPRYRHDGLTSAPR